VTAPRIALVVEGYGDRDAVPTVVRSYLSSIGEYEIAPAKPLNAKGRGNLTKEGQLEKFVRQAVREPGTGGVLVVLDAESDPACELGPALLERASEAAAPVPARVCLAVRKFENWIAASDLQDPPWYPGESGYEGGGADAAIRAWSPTGVYAKTAMQPGFAARLNLALVRARCPSFERLLGRVDDLRALIRAGMEPCP
jgi:hypothetical protein